MNVLDDEVFAVLLAIVVVASVFSAAMTLRPEVVEAFTAIGLLNEECKIGDYPERAFPGESLKLCIFLDNHMGYPMMLQVRYKIGTSETLPTNTTASPQPAVESFTRVLDHGENATMLVEVPVDVPRELVGRKVALIFELWAYDVNKHEWVYTGRWNHLYVKIVEAPLP